MASDKIKGLTVKIGADTSDFIKSLKGVDREINQTQRQANELQKGLALKFDDKRFVEAQKQVQKALQETEEKAEAIRKQLKYLEDTGNVDTEGYQKLQTELAKTENNALKLQEQLKQIDKIKFDSATKEIVKLSNDLETAAKKTAALSLAAGGALAGMVKLAKDAVKVGDDIQTTADKFNLSAEAIQKWSYIAMQSDVASEQLYKGMAKVRVAIGTALTGESNNASKAIEKLVGDVSLLPSDTEKAFETVVIALSEVEDKTLQAYYANSIFGEEMATNLIPLLNQGADGIKQFSQEFEQVGYLSNEQVANLSKFDNQLNMVNQQFQNAKTELGIALLPVLESFARILENVVVPAIKKVSEWFDSLPQPMKDIMTGALMLVAALSPVLLIMSKLVGVVPNLIKMFSNLKNMSWQAVAGFAAMGAALGLVFDLIGNWRQMSILEKILKSLALAALVAAAAITVFHASWSLGIAVGAIAAGIVAGIAAINSAGKNIGIDTNFSDQSSITDAANRDYKIPSSTGGGSSTYNEDNSQYNIEINLNASGNLDYDAKNLADEVIKQIVTKKQAMGR